MAKGKRKKAGISWVSLISAFPQTRKVYKRASEVTGPLRITGVRPTVKGGIAFRKKRISSVFELPTLQTIKKLLDNLFK